MPAEVIVALIGLLGSAIGSLAGILVSNKMTQYRLEQLEKKVQAHNNLIDRMYHAETRLTLIEEQNEQFDKRLSTIKV